jgi:hypothetical protein
MSISNLVNIRSGEVHRCSTSKEAVDDPDLTFCEKINAPDDSGEF